MSRFLVLFLLLCSGFLQAFTLYPNARVKGWQSETVTFDIYSQSCGVTDEALLTALDEAIGMWNSIASSRLVLKRGSLYSSGSPNLAASANQDTGVIFCDTDFAASTNYDANSVAAVGPSTLDANYNITFGYVRLNAQSGANARISAYTSSTLARLVGHEIGHVLGLGHSSDANSIMRSTNNLPSQDDFDGITYLYPRQELSGKKMMGCAAVHSSESPQLGSVLISLLFFILLLVLPIGIGRTKGSGTWG